MKVSEIAKHMLNTGNNYTAAELSRELKVPITKVNSALHNIRRAEKYRTVESEKPNRTVRVISIAPEKGKKINSAALWAIALRQKSGAVSKTLTS